MVARGVVYHRPGLGPGTSAEAEWLALLHAMEVATMLGATECLFVGDALMVVDQANGRFACRGALRAFLAEFKERSTGFDRVRVRHVRRSQNLAGVALDRLRSGLGPSSSTAR